jgi:hypothetical protein
MHGSASGLSSSGLIGSVDGNTKVLHPESIRAAISRKRFCVLEFLLERIEFHAERGGVSCVTMGSRTDIVRRDSKIGRCFLRLVCLLFYLVSLDCGYCGIFTPAVELPASSEASGASDGKRGD